MNHIQTSSRSSKIVIRKSYFLLGVFFLFIMVAFGVTSLNPILKESVATTAKPATPQPKKEVLAAYTTCNVNPGDFTDVPPGHPAAEAVYAMAKCCVVKGKTPTQFAPNSPILRAEVAYLIARYHRQIRQDWPEDAPNTAHYFKDVRPTDWDAQAYRDIQTNKYNGFLLGLDSPPTSTNCQDRVNNLLPYSLPGNPYKSYPFYSLSPCELDAFGVWQFGFHGIKRSDTWRGAYNFLVPPLEYPEPAGQPRADYIRLMYEYFKEIDPNANTPLGACLNDQQATCNITADDCQVVTPGGSCNVNVSWSPNGQAGSDISIFKDSNPTPIATGANGNIQDSIAENTTHTYFCRNNGTLLDQDDAKALPASTYTIEGVVFYDKNGNKKRDNPIDEPKYTGSAFTIVNNRGVPVTMDPNPSTSYRFAVTAGMVTVTINTTLPNQYTMSVPVSRSWFYPTMGVCNQAMLTGPPTNSPEAQCNGQNIINLNFGITDSYAWSQFTGMDVREDMGFKRKVPKTVNPLCRDTKGVVGNPGYSSVASYTNIGAVGSLTQTSGVIFNGGSSNLDYGGDFGNLSKNNWLIDPPGDARNQYKSPPLRISYSALLEAQKQTKDPIKPFDCGGGTCIIPTASGIYHFDGDPLTPYPLVAAGGAPKTTIKNNQKVVVLLDGGVKFTQPIEVENGSVFILAATGKMLVDYTLGQGAYNCAAPAVLQGIYSTNDSFEADGRPSVCDPSSDLMLIIDGTVITNADLKANPVVGSFINSRSLCAENLEYPSVVIRQRPDFIVNLPNFVKNQKTTFRELRP